MPGSIPSLMTVSMLGSYKVAAFSVNYVLAQYPFPYY